MVLNRNKAAIKAIARKNFIPEVLQLILFMAGLPACSVFRDLPRYLQSVFDCFFQWSESSKNIEGTYGYGYSSGFKPDSHFKVSLV
jgi:hypothetical protein